MAERICGMDAVTLAAAIKKKELSPVEVVDAHLARIGELEPVIHSFCLTIPEHARYEARELETRIMRGEEVGPLAGVPIGVKDLVCTAGIPTVSGSIAYK